MIFLHCTKLTKMNEKWKHLVFYVYNILEPMCNCVCVCVPMFLCVEACVQKLLDRRRERERQRPVIS